MNSEMQKNIDGYIAACERCNTSPERLRQIKTTLEDFQSFCKIKERAAAETARLFLTSKL